MDTTYEGVSGHYERLKQEYLHELPPEFGTLDVATQNEVLEFLEKRPMAPFNVTPTLTIMSWGRLIMDFEPPHAYPSEGYVSQKKFFDFENPDDYATYVCCIHSVEDKKKRFQTYRVGKPQESIFGPTTGACWSEITRRRRKNMKNPNRSTVSGPLFFGVADSIVKRWLVFNTASLNNIVKRKAKQSSGSKKKTVVVAPPTLKRKRLGEYGLGKILKRVDTGYNDKKKRRRTKNTNSEFEVPKLSKEAKLVYFDEHYPITLQSHHVPVPERDCNLKMDRKHLIELHHRGIKVSGIPLDMTLNSDETVLAVATSYGFVELFDTENYTAIGGGHNHTPISICEYTSVSFSPDDNYLVLTSVRKDRKTYDPYEQDLAIQSSQIDIYDAELLQKKQSALIASLSGHKSGVYFGRWFKRKNEDFYISSGRDGKVIIWKYCQTKDFILEIHSSIQDTKYSSHILYLDFIPGCDNRYFLASVDNYIKLYDLETKSAIAIFESGHTSFCDFLKFVPLKTKDLTFISRGSEIREFDESITPSKIFVRRLDLSNPNLPKVENISIVTNSLYDSPHYSVRMAFCNQRFLVAPSKRTAMIFDIDGGSGNLMAELVNDSSGRCVIMQSNPVKFYISSDSGLIRVFLSRPIQHINENAMKI